MEVFFSFEAAGDDFPEQEQIAGDCLEQFEDFVGTPYPMSVLDIRVVAPDLKAWYSVSERTVACSVFDMTGESLVGSVEGSGL